MKTKKRKQLDEVYAIIGDYSNGKDVCMKSLYDSLCDLARIAILSTMQDFRINLSDEEVRRINTDVASDVFIIISSNKLDVGQIYHYCKLRSRGYLLTPAAEAPENDILSEKKSPRHELVLRNFRIMIEDMLIRYTESEKITILAMVEFPSLAIDLEKAFKKEDWLKLWLKSLSIRKQLITTPNVHVQDDSSLRKLAVYSILEQYDRCLPVLAMELGLSGFLKLTDVIGGRKVSIPTREKLEELLRDAHEDDKSILVTPSNFTLANYYQKFMDTLSEKYDKIATSALHYAKECDVNTVIKLLSELRKEVERGMDVIQLSIKMISNNEIKK